MYNSEFDVIKKYFSFSSSDGSVILAGGDDCAAVSVPVDRKLLVTTDTLISGVHFPDNSLAENVAYKALMVNLSDLAAMGATPSWITLAITMPGIDECWLSSFSEQLSKLLSDYKVSLIGGDTTKGPLSITIQAMGLCDEERMMRRDQAKQGDKVFVTGYLGDAAIGLCALLDDLNDDKLSACVDRLNRPEAHIEFAKELSEYSRCAIDISDGLAADLGHIATASDCGVRVSLTEVPLSPSARYYFKHYHNDVIDWSMVLARGDDYELCFTLNNEHVQAVKKISDKWNVSISCIGEVTESNGLIFYSADNELFNFSDSGFKHF